MAQAYKLGSNNSKIRIPYNDDQTRKDVSSAKVMAINEVNAGIRNKWEYRRDFFGEDEKQAKANTPVMEAPDAFNFGA